MNSSPKRHSLIIKTFQVGANTLLSRIFGLFREIMLMRLLGIGVMADAFTTAFMLPNSLRKIFAEGALTSAFVPTFIESFKKEGKESANGLMTLSFVVFESLLLLLCGLIMYKARGTILLIAPGYSEAHIQATIPLLQIMMPLIFFISSSALLAGALNSVHHFFVPAFSPVLLNLFFLGGIGGCMYYNYSISFLCWAIMAGGAVQCLMHIMAYFYYGFSFSSFSRHTVTTFMSMLTKFLFCFMSNSVMELGLFVDQQFASYLQTGTVTLIKYAHRFMGIPLGVFAVAFSTILLPYFTRVKIENPEKVEYYLQEALKLVLWVMIPATIIMTFFSEEIFLTIFASSSSKFPVHRIPEAGHIFAGFMSGLIFFSLNKIMITLFFALHNTRIPTLVTSTGTILNIGLNFILVKLYGATGLALATSCGGFFQTILFLYFLRSRYNYGLNGRMMARFIGRYLLIIAIIFGAFYKIYKCSFVYIQQTASPFFVSSFGFWLWVGPLILTAYGLLYASRKFIGEKIDLLG